MGTRSTVKFYSEFNQEEVVLAVYQQYDGYIEGVGYTLAKWLKDKKVVNGYNGDQKMKDGYANGMGCLAAQYVADHKTEIGGFYCTTANNHQEYDYKVRLVDGKLEIEVDKFKGSPDELLNYKEVEE